MRKCICKTGEECTQQKKNAHSERLTLDCFYVIIEQKQSIKVCIYD